MRSVGQVDRRRWRVEHGLSGNCYNVYSNESGTGTVELVHP
jgi:hypothetical protein|tara:strand:- start:866 stop:988 length:123 start_codon:yes stop_codon:yes gene_type:complete